MVIEQTNSLLEANGSDSKEHFAKRIWLAGLGAYGKSLDEMKNLSVNGDSHDLFNELVDRGEALQREATDRVKLRIRSSNLRLEARIEELKRRVYSGNSIDQKLNRVNETLSRLSKDEC